MDTLGGCQIDRQIDRDGYVRWLSDQIDRYRDGYVRWCQIDQIDRYRDGYVRWLSDR